MINHILVPLDGAALAECVLPHVLAIASAFEARITLLHVLECSHIGGGKDAIDSADWHLKKCEAQVILGTVIRKPEILHRFPLSEEDLELVTRIVEKNYDAASQCLEQLHSQLSLQGIDLQTRLAISDNLIASLHGREGN
jgi:nucleotide-binding universal stress UspA family protein